MHLWDKLCIHACYHHWNPLSLILRDDWVASVWRAYGFEYPGWKAFK